MCQSWCVQPNVQSMERQMAERAKRLKKVKEKHNTVEDEIFTKFCTEIGVANIRYVLGVVTFSQRCYV